MYCYSIFVQTYNIFHRIIADYRKMSKNGGKIDYLSGKYMQNVTKTSNVVKFPLFSFKKSLSVLYSFLSLQQET